MCHDPCVVLQVSRPYEVAEFDIMYGDGINNLGCLVDVGKEMGVLEARVSSQAALLWLNSCISSRLVGPCCPDHYP